MSTDEVKHVARRFYEEVLNGGSLLVADEILAANYIDHGSPQDAPPGVKGFRRFYEMVSGVFPDLHVIIEDMIVEGDKVAVRLTITGTQSGAFQEFPPTGRRATWGGMDFLRLAGGRIAERWSERDFLGMLRQVGALTRQ